MKAIRARLKTMRTTRTGSSSGVSGSLAGIIPLPAAAEAGQTRRGNLFASQAPLLSRGGELAHFIDPRYQLHYYGPTFSESTCLRMRSKLSALIILSWCLINMLPLRAQTSRTGL